MDTAHGEQAALACSAVDMTRRRTDTVRQTPCMDGRVDSGSAGRCGTADRAPCYPVTVGSGRHRVFRCIMRLSLTRRPAMAPRAMARAATAQPAKDRDRKSGPSTNWATRQPGRHETGSDRLNADNLHNRCPIIMHMTNSGLFRSTTHALYHSHAPSTAPPIRKLAAQVPDAQFPIDVLCTEEQRLK